MRATWSQLDVNGDGNLTAKEISDALRNTGKLDTDVAMIQSAINRLEADEDGDGDGILDFAEFMRMMGTNYHEETKAGLVTSAENFLSDEEERRLEYILGVEPVVRPGGERLELCHILKKMGCRLFDEEVNIDVLKSIGYALRDRTFEPNEVHLSPFCLECITHLILTVLPHVGHLQAWGRCSALLHSLGWYRGSMEELNTPGFVTLDPL